VPSSSSPPPSPSSSLSLGDAAERVRARLAELPGGRLLLDGAGEARGTRVALVGGAVRDLLRGATPHELDVVVEGDAAAVAQTLAERSGGARVVAHDRFGTATVALGEGEGEGEGARNAGWSIDLAGARTESYPAPGALPDVTPATLEADLDRRDFTVNTLALPLDDPTAELLGAGGVLDDRPPPGDLPAARGGVEAALEDLREGRLRVLHPASFLDDPTRLWRMARYAHRLRFTPEPQTAKLAAAAVAGGALATVSGARLGAELRLLLAEEDPVGAFAVAADLGVLRAVHPRLRVPSAAVATALATSPGDVRPDLLVLTAAVMPLVLSVAADPDAELRVLLDRLEFPAGDRDRVLAAARAVPELVSELPHADRPSAIRAALRDAPVEAVVLAGALGPAPAADAAARWLGELRHVGLEITGHDLLAAGMPPGPAVGRALEAAIARRLDGELAPGREAELAAALEAGR
jgi:tRNA nucleotidyltransferase (CCA-adding enzyme)